MADEETPLPGGPPAPIALLRRLSSEVDAQIAERVESETINSNGKRRAQDPPARERPAVSTKSADDVHIICVHLLSSSNYVFITRHKLMPQFLPFRPFFLVNRIENK